VSYLERERWYVGMAVQEGGVNGLLSMVEKLDVGAVARNIVSVMGFSEGWLLHMRSSIPCLLLP
jgi:hypothetical protein